MIHIEFMVWREGYLQAPSLRAPGSWRRFYRRWEGPPPFTRDHPGLRPIPERPSRPLPAGGATAHGRRLRRQGLSGRRGRSQRDGKRKLRWRSALQSARLSRCLVPGRSRAPHATLAAPGAEDSPGGAMLGSGQMGEAPATPVRRP